MLVYWGNKKTSINLYAVGLVNDFHFFLMKIIFKDIGGLETLINLLETKDLKCKLGALSVLSALSVNSEVRRCIADLGGVEILVKNLSDPARDLLILVAETLYNVSQIRKGRMQVRKAGGIPKLVDLLDINETFLLTSREVMGIDENEIVDLAKASVRALYSISQSKKNIQVMMKAGVVPLLARLLRSIHQDVVIPTAGTISRCGFDSSYQLAIQTEGMVKDLVRQLTNEDPLLRRYCAEAIFKCSEDPITRDLVRQAGGLDPLVAMAKDPKTRSDKPLLAAVTGAIWKTAITPKNVERYDQLGTVKVDFYF